MRIEILVEEPSMKVFLDHFLRKLSLEAEWEVFNFRSKEQLLLRLPERLRGYAGMMHSGYEAMRVLVLVDRDDNDCHQLKKTLEEFTADAGLRSLSMARHEPTALPREAFQVVNRIVCEELEAWYFGDPDACISAYNRLKINHFSNTHLQAPDAIKGGTWEAFGRLLHKAGHLPANPPDHRWKYEAAQAIGPHIDSQRNRSPSFQVFLSGLFSFFGQFGNLT